MLFASSKDALRRALVGVAAEIQATAFDEVAHETGASLFALSARHPYLCCTSTGAHYYRLTNLYPAPSFDVASLSLTDDVWSGLVWPSLSSHLLTYSSSGFISLTDLFTSVLIVLDKVSRGH